MKTKSNSIEPKLSLFQESAKSSWTLSVTALSQAEHCPDIAESKLSIVQKSGESKRWLKAEHCLGQCEIRRTLSGTVPSRRDIHKFYSLWLVFTWSDYYLNIRIRPISFNKINNNIEIIPKVIVRNNFEIECFGSLKWVIANIGTIKNKISYILKYQS